MAKKKSEPAKSAAEPAAKPAKSGKSSKTSKTTKPPKSDKSAKPVEAAASVHPVWTVIDALPDPALLLDTNGVILHANPAFEKLLGLKIKDISGKQALEGDLLPDELQQLLEKRQRKLGEGSDLKALAHHEIVFKTPKGDQLFIDLSANVIEYGDAKADMVVLRDVTEYQQAEQPGEVTESPLAIIEEEVNDIVLITDDTFTITQVSPSVSDILGYATEDLAGINLPEIIHPDDAPDIEDILSSIDWAFNRETPVQFRLLCKDGGPQYVELVSKNAIEEPSTGGLMLRMRDITEWKQAQAELRETESKFKAIFENANDAIVYFDATGRIVDGNPKVKDVLGYSREDIVGKHFAEIGLIPYENLQNIKALFENAVSSGDITEQGEYEVQRKDGIPISVGVSAGSITGESGLEGLFVIVRDITWRKETESRVEHLNEILMAIRNVNQIIVREKDFDRLIQSSCDTLIETHGYETAWVVIPNDYGEITSSGEAGTGGLFSSLANQINQGHWPQCAQLALAQSGTILTNDPTLYCLKCPLLEICGKRGALTIRLEHAGKIFGVFTVSGIHKQVTAQEEMNLFEETAYDISFGLHSIEIGRERDEAEQRIREQNREIQLQFVELENANAELKQTQKKLLSANQMLRESEDRYRTLIDNSGVPIVYFARNGRILTINTVAAVNLNGQPSDFIGKSIYDLFPDSADEAMSIMRKVIEEERGISFESFQKLPTGVFWFSTSMYPVRDSNGKVFAVQTIARDITEERQAKAALGETQAKLRLIFDTIKDGITISDLEGNIIDANKAGLERHGYSSVEELRGMKGIDFIAEQDRERATRDMTEALSSGDRAPRLVEYTLLAHDGREIPVEATASLLYDDDGNPIAFVNVTRDITERRKAEEAIRRNEERFRAMLDKSSDGIAVVKPDGTIDYEGPVNQRILGYEGEETPAKTIFDLIHPDDKARLTADYTGVMEKPGAHVTAKYHVQHKDGSWRILEVVATNLIDDPAIEGIVVNFRDITERQRAEEAIKASEEKFKDIFNNVNDEIMYLDRDGNVIDVNKRVRDIFGYDPQEIIGRNFSEFKDVFRDDQERIARTFFEVIETGETNLTELTGRRKDGSTFYAEVSPSVIRSNGEIQGMLIVVRDITKRKQAEGLFYTLTTNSQIGSYIIQDGVFKFVNPAFLKDLGLTEQDLLNKPALDIVHPGDRDRVRQEAIKMLKGESDSGYEFRAIDKYGNTRHAYEKVTSIEYQGKRATLGSYMDITEHKKIDEQLARYRSELEKRVEELQKAYEQLQEVDRLKDTFLSTVSHELRTPLSSIKSFTEILLTYEDDRETQREFLNIINEESDRLTRLLNDFLDLSKIESGRMQWEEELLDINQVIDTSLTTIQSLATDANLELNVNLTPGLPQVYGDKDRLVQVVTNLLSNAIKFTPPQGRITVKSELLKGDPSLGKPDMTKVSVTDTGKGIHPEEQQNIFDKFAQVAKPDGSKPKGTGLGLSICKEIITHYGGTIWVESEPEKGSTFTFTIPVMKNQPASGTASAEPGTMETPEEPPPSATTDVPA